MADSQFCFFHDPSKGRERTEARKAGGIERAHKRAVLAPDTPERSLTNGAEVSKLLGETINQVRRGELDPRIAYPIANLAAVLLKALERSALEERVARLEAVLKTQSPHSYLSSASPEPEKIKFIFENPTAHKRDNEHQ